MAVHRLCVGAEELGERLRVTGPYPGAQRNFHTHLCPPGTRHLRDAAHQCASPSTSPNCQGRRGSGAPARGLPGNSTLLRGNPTPKRPRFSRSANSVGWPKRPDRTFAFDEFGPLGIRPTAGTCWARQSRPDRHPATFHRTHGVRYFHGCHSVGDDTLWGVNHRRKGTDHTLTALKSIRAARPDGAPVYVILDNLSADIRWGGRPLRPVP